jgi:hypothetical protein
VTERETRGGAILGLIVALVFLLQWLWAHGWITWPRNR